MTAYTYHLDPELATGSNDGSSAANAWQSWADCFSYLNTNHADLTTGGDTVTVKVYSDETFTGAGPTLAVASTETYWLKFIAADGLATPLQYGAGAPRVTLSYTGGSSIGALVFNAATDTPVWYIFDGLEFFYEISVTATGSHPSIFQNTTGNKLAGSRLIFESCYFMGEANPHASGKRSIYAQFAGRLIAKFYNSVIENFTTTGGGACQPIYSLRNASEGINEFVNTTLINCDNYNYESSNKLAINCLVIDSAYSGGTFTSASGKNAGNAASGLPGSDNTHSISTTNLFVSATDRHLQAGNDYGAGPSDSTYGSYVPTTDADGDTRSGTTADAGADEYVSSGVSVSLTGVQAAGQVGSLAPTGGALISLTGVQAAGQVGTLTIETASGVSVSLTGVQAAGQVGSLAPTGGAAAVLLGVQAAGQVGNLSILGDVIITLTGVQAAGQVGTLTIETAGGVSVSLTGVQATGQIGSLVATGGAIAIPGGVSALGVVGNLSTRIDTIVNLLGVSAEGLVGALDITGGANVTITGVLATGQIGSLTINTGLSEVEIPGHRILKVQHEDRTYLVVYEDRTCSVENEDRANKVLH